MGEDSPESRTRESLLNTERDRAPSPFDSQERALMLKAGETVKKSEIARFKKQSRGLVLALAVVIALVGFNVNIPGGKSSASNWKFVFTHPTILLHIIVAAIILVVAVIALITSVRSRNWSWVALSIIGLAFVLLAFASGENYVVTLRKSELGYMSVGWLGAVVAYGIGWYLSRRKERQRKGALLPVS